MRKIAQLISQRQRDRHMQGIRLLLCLLASSAYSQGDSALGTDRLRSVTTLDRTVLGKEDAGRRSESWTQGRVARFAQNPSRAAAQLRSLFDVWGHVKPTAASQSEEYRIVRGLTLKLLCGAFAESQDSTKDLAAFPEFLAEEFCYGELFMNIRNKGFGSEIEDVLVEFIGTYYDRAPIDLKLRMTAKLLEIAADSRASTAKAAKASRASKRVSAVPRFDLRYQALLMFHEAGPLFQKYIQMFGAKVEHPDAREIVNTFKSSIAPMPPETLKAVLEDAYMMSGPSNSSSDFILNLGKLGTYRINVQPQNAASICQGHLARLVEQGPGTLGHDGSSGDSSCTRVRKKLRAMLGCFVCAGPALRNERLGPNGPPTLFLKVLRPRLVSYLKMEREMLKQSTTTKIGARAVLDDHWHQVLGELDLEREQRMQAQAAGAYNGIWGYPNIQVVRSLGLWRSARKVAEPNQEFKATVLAMETAPGVDYQTLLEQKRRGRRALTRAREVYISAFRLWLERALQKGSGFVHGDPHLGNLFYSWEGNLLTFIDFGNAYTVPKKYDIAKQLQVFLLGAIAGDAAKILQVFPLSNHQATSEFKKHLNAEMKDFSPGQYMSLSKHELVKAEYERRAWRTAFHCVVQFQAFGTAPTVLYTFLRALILQWNEGWLALHDPAIYDASKEEKQRFALLADLAPGAPNRGPPRPPGPMDFLKGRLAAKVSLAEGADLLMRARKERRKGESSVWTNNMTVTKEDADEHGEIVTENADFKSDKASRKISFAHGILASAAILGMIAQCMFSQGVRS